jgi:hypothetical protein
LLPYNQQNWLGSVIFWNVLTAVGRLFFGEHHEVAGQPVSERAPMLKHVNWQHRHMMRTTMEEAKIKIVC